MGPRLRFNSNIAPPRAVIFPNMTTQLPICPVAAKSRGLDWRRGGYGGNSIPSWTPDKENPHGRTSDKIPWRKPKLKTSSARVVLKTFLHSTSLEPLDVFSTFLYYNSLDVFGIWDRWLLPTTCFWGPLTYGVLPPLRPIFLELTRRVATESTHTQYKFVFRLLFSSTSSGLPQS